MTGSPQSGGSGQNKQILLEFVVQGAVVKVTAIDAASGCEAIIVAPASSPRTALEQAAARKLAYVMKKQRGEA
jgi:hypothetical protein